jgi:hypothetical protein
MNLSRNEINNLLIECNALKIIEVCCSRTSITTK